MSYIGKEPSTQTRVRNNSIANTYREEQNKIDHLYRGMNKVLQRYNKVYSVNHLAELISVDSRHSELSEMNSLRGSIAMRDQRTRMPAWSLAGSS
jgi:hypothetical protein